MATATGPLPAAGDIFTPLDLNGPRLAIKDSCRICFDEHLLHNMAVLPNCEHRYCRNCITNHVRAKMSDLIFPIYCPVCVVEGMPLDMTQIDQDTLRHLKDLFTQEDHEKFEFLQLSRHAMLLQCPECNHGMMVANEDLSNVLVTCPVPTCGSNWCRACYQPVSSCGRHKCKQDRKFRRLMRRERWKFCPGCRTPIQRIEGCPHMTCKVPGCNTHFCYRCGGNIWRPGQRGNPWDAASWHNKWCRMVFVFGCPLQ